MKAIPVAQTCRLLGVSRAGFYEAKRRAARPDFCKVSVHLRAAFMSSGQSYGSRRLVTAPGWSLQGAQLDAPSRIDVGMEAQVRAYDR